MPEVKVEMPPMHVAEDHGATDDALRPERDASNMKRVQSNVGEGLRITFKVSLHEAHDLPAPHQAWPQNLTYTVKSSYEKGKTLKLLDNVTGFFEPGEMCALMGPSGTGQNGCHACTRHSGAHRQWQDDPSGRHGRSATFDIR